MELLSITLEDRAHQTTCTRIRLRRIYDPRNRIVWHNARIRAVVTLHPVEPPVPGYRLACGRPVQADSRARSIHLRMKKEIPKHNVRWIATAATAIKLGSTKSAW